MKRLIINISFALILNPAAQASWVSSGGGSFRLEKNPWFVKNTERVSYCMEFDSTSMSISKSEAVSGIRDAIAYWKSELALGSSRQVMGFTAIGTQEFVFEEQCHVGETHGEPKEEIVFKFGYGALNPSEVEWLKNPSEYIGITIRKEYDEVQMKGRGIVYISGDRGDHTYKNGGHLVTEAWSKPKLLSYALIHELGHVMGVAHTGTGVMAETFLTSLLNKNLWTFYASRPLISMTRSLATAEVCTPDIWDTFESGFFGLDINQKCLKLERAAGSNDWSVSSRQNSQSGFNAIGTLKILPNATQSLALKPLIYVYLPESQIVFKGTEIGFSDFLIGAVTEGGISQGIFTRNGSLKPYYVQLNYDSESIVLSGIVGNQIKTVFNYRLPTLKGIVFP